jgi:hypothetical protein
MEDLLTSVNPLWKNQVDSRGRVVSVEKFKELFDACVEYENGPLIPPQPVPDGQAVVGTGVSAEGGG